MNCMNEQPSRPLELGSEPWRPGILSVGFAQAVFPAPEIEPKLWKKRLGRTLSIVQLHDLGNHSVEAIVSP